MNKTYISGSGCTKEGSCNYSCKDCNFYKKSNPENQYGKCNNPDSVNYQDEVYDNACCFYVCQFLYYGRE